MIVVVIVCEARGSTASLLFGMCLMRFLSRDIDALPRLEHSRAKGPSSVSESVSIRGATA
jgi:hypothetical protein